MKLFFTEENSVFSMVQYLITAFLLSFIQIHTHKQHLSIVWGRGDV